MTEVSCYVMDLWCDLDRPNDSGHGGEMEFTGPTRADCVRQAKQSGWVFRHNGIIVCPKCSGKPDLTPKSETKSPEEVARGPDSIFSAFGK